VVRKTSRTARSRSTAMRAARRDGRTPPALWLRWSKPTPGVLNGMSFSQKRKPATAITWTGWAYLAPFSLPACAAVTCWPSAMLVRNRPVPRPAINSSA
jgi:hypothetical protein